MVLDVGNIMEAGQRARLLAMQKTARQLDVVSARLASGLKVNSAIDNPNSFFVARALRSRAGDLEKLLDGIGQNIRAVQEADNGIKAQLKILDQAESYLREIEKKYMAGEVPLGTPLNETYVTFGSPADLITYVVGQDGAGTVTVPSANEVRFQGNLWKRKAFNYNVTADTVLIFEYQSSLIQEVSTIGFDNDTNFGNDDNRFWIYGTQTSGITYAAPFTTYDYSGSGAWERIEIPVGAFLTGNFTHMTFVNDDDAAPLGNGAFRNITLREGPVQLPGGDGSAFERGYQDIIDQLDLVAKDAHYRGINLLKKDVMTTYFNTAGTSKLVTEGIDATSAVLGLGSANFDSLEAVRAKLEQVRIARNTLRSYASTLALDLNVIQIRQDFTNGQINVSKAGADDLTLAHLNEEGAELLALQARQQLQSIIMSMRPANVLTILS